MLRLSDSSESRLAVATLGGAAVTVLWHVIPPIVVALGSMFGSFSPKGGGPPTGTAGGDLTGSYPNPTLALSIPTAPNFTNGITVTAGKALDSGAAGALNIGPTNATTVVIGKSGATVSLASGAIAGAGLTSERCSCAYNSANLAAAASFGQFGSTNASTLVAFSNMAHDIAGTGTGTFVVKLCSDGTTCAGGNVYLTCTAGANCATAAAGRVDPCTLTKSAVAAATTLTWSVGTACGTTDPGVNVCACLTTP